MINEESRFGWRVEGGNRGEPDREHDIAKRVSIPHGLREMSARRSSIVKLSLVRSVGFYRAIMSGIIRHRKRFAMKDRIVRSILPRRMLFVLTLSSSLFCFL